MSRHPKFIKPRRSNVLSTDLNLKQQGYLLVESMVALAVFSIALVSLAGAQLTTAKNTVSSAMKTESTISSSELIDTMRTNLAGVQSGDYDVDFGDIPTVTGSSSQGIKDIYGWITDLRDNKLKGTTADGEVVCAGLVCTVSIRWLDNRAAQSYIESEADAVDVQFTHTVRVTL